MCTAGASCRKDFQGKAEKYDLVTVFNFLKVTCSTKRPVRRDGKGYGKMDLL